MKIKLIKLTLLLLAFSSCNKQNVTENSSEQIKTEIAKVSKNSEENTDPITISSELVYTESMNSEQKNVKTKSKDGLTLMKQNCYACHSVTTKSHDDIIAPPMIAVKRRYLKEYDSKEDFVKAFVDYASDPKAENALMFGAVDKFKVMPKQSFAKDDLTKIAVYVFDNEIETPEWFEDHLQQNHKKGKGMGKGKNKQINN
ncbi:c-type cytochrome [Flavobacterium sp.]|uniref:c-type cytochrome n=1 Tax=Flavobacterium sp. TaxID=239 RepID=UPI00262C16FE|nr:c-type cytochrome [Flavobacterium sp.]MDD2985338.1 c-type cytochrome [Flavobacterium sp.]